MDLLEAAVDGVVASQDEGSQVRGLAALGILSLLEVGVLDPLEVRQDVPVVPGFLEDLQVAPLLVLVLRENQQGLSPLSQ